ncbi:MAG: hypothetical protein IKT32_04875, partial [Clostridia bacterium]|nr:hypothetical protein [Clostridia bacterium]
MKKELTLQDILNQTDKDFKLFCSSFATLKEKLAENCESFKTEQTEIPNTAYVTLTDDGCFVGGEPATKYNGEDIYRPYLCVAYFKEAKDIVRKEYGYELLELRCLQSSTEGEWVKTGNPVPDKDGTYVWVRAVYKDKENQVVSSLWVFSNDYGSASDCASDCTSDCGDYVQFYADLRSGLF